MAEKARNILNKTENQPLVQPPVFRRQRLRLKGVEIRLIAFNGGVERRLAALKSSTQINRFQHRLLPPPFSSTNSLGDGVCPKIRFPRRSLHHHFPVAVNVSNCPSWPWIIRGRGLGRGRCLAVDGSQPVPDHRGMTVSKTVRSRVSTGFATGLAT
jgi:hypothetical protein